MVYSSNGASLEEAFKISLKGESIVGEVEFAKSLLNEIKGLNDCKQ